MKNNDIKELPDLLDKYGRKIIITNYIKELTNFLDEHGVDYKIVENRVGMDATLKAEWERLKKVLNPVNWDAGQEATYFGFFCHGWYGRLNEAAYQAENNNKAQLEEIE